jgi:hypothetical protein
MFCTEIQDGLAGLTVDNTDAALAPDKATNQIYFTKYLRLISEKTQQINKLVFIIDEIGSLSEELASTLFPSIRSIFTRGRSPSIDRDFYKKIMFIFAGSLDLDKLIQGQNSPLRNICKTFTLDDFSLEQVLDLAQNLTNFSPEIVEVIADCVHQWGDGHPYLTQRLLGLIDESQECRSASNDSLPGDISQLVKEHILTGNDANLAHIFHYLRNSGDSYCQAVSQILRSESGERKETASHADELILMGIIKRSSNLHIIIRNKFYEEALKIFFEQESRNRGRT